MEAGWRDHGRHPCCSTCHRIPGSFWGSSFGSVTLGTACTYLQTLDTPHVGPEVIWSTLFPAKVPHRWNLVHARHMPWPGLPSTSGSSLHLRIPGMAGALEDSQYTVKFSGSLRLTLTGFHTSHW
ncbi:uncharacterized protein LOC100502736 [Mus musculus]|uniref:Predicted gene, 19345 n=1 Tax=Mus musculus TaxID=10090 RepID=G3UYD9_MOUSE|nr:uncharacterized protein LOC100502736 [Mus musculus]|eukprot:NP_001257418.1 uncharacterized protein LOC100502736 [Mus musculus]